MMQRDKREMDEKESLALITEMIGKARNHFHESGTSAILWGAVVCFCGLMSFAQNYWEFRIGFDIWILTLVAILPQIFISIRENRNKSVRTHQQSATDAIWIVYAISIFALLIYRNIVPGVSNGLMEKYDGIRLVKQHIDTGALEPAGAFVPSFSSLLLLIYAFPTMCTGLAFRFRPMIIGAILCYGFFIASLYTASTYDFLFMGLAGIFNWLIPGIFLRNRYMRARHV